MDEIADAAEQPAAPPPVRTPQAVESGTTEAAGEQPEPKKNQSSEGDKDAKSSDAPKPIKSTDPPQKSGFFTRISKPASLRMTVRAGVLLLVIAVACLVLSSIVLAKTLQLMNSMLNSMSPYCRSHSLSADCLMVDPVTTMPWYAFLIWAIVLILTVLLLFHGAYRESTASLDSFVWGSAGLTLFQVAFAALALAVAAQLPVGGSVTGATEANLKVLWRDAPGPWQSEFGCGLGVNATADEFTDCVSGLYKTWSSVLAGFMLPTIAVQGVAMLFATRLKLWISLDRGQDVFAIVRLTHAARAGMIMCSLTVFIVGVVLVSTIGLRGRR